MAAARAGSRPAADGGCDTARRQYGHGWFRRIARHRLQDPTWEFRSESSLRRLEASTRKAAGAGGGDSGPSSVGLDTVRHWNHCDVRCFSIARAGNHWVITAARYRITRSNNFSLYRNRLPQRDQIITAPQTPTAQLQKK